MTIATDAAPGVGQREHGREADVLGADDHRAMADATCSKRDELLERAGGVDAGRPVAGHQAGGAGSLADAGGEDDGSGIDGAPTVRPSSAK